MNNSMNQGEQSSRNDYSNQNNSDMENASTQPNFESEQKNRLHSDRVNAGEHNPEQDETQYGKTREDETGYEKMERKAGEMKDKMNEGIDKTKNKMNEWGDQMKDKMNEWGDKSDSKLDEADRKMDKAQDHLNNNFENQSKQGYEQPSSMNPNNPNPNPTPSNNPTVGTDGTKNNPRDYEDKTTGNR